MFSITRENHWTEKVTTNEIKSQHLGKIGTCSLQCFEKNHITPVIELEYVSYVANKDNLHA